MTRTHQIIKIFILLFILLTVRVVGQRDSIYDREEEILDDGKRYRLHNNYLTFGAGYLGSSIRDKEQPLIGFDFVFHIKRMHFQTGFLMSGDEFLSNNNINGHLGFGYRKENENLNLAFFAGPSYNTGVIPPYVDGADTVPPRLFDAIGFYGSASIIKKITYDIGVGGEFIFEVDKEQVYAGLKVVMFFSGAYRGKAKIYNKHVKPVRN
ncbi:MAG: hypothetical protein AB7O73_05225 [Bacteroidia bacterium]